MSNIRIQLLNVINRESSDSMNFIIAQYILENLDRRKVITTKELADNCNVSKSSISRFCRKIGYEDFMELQYAIATYNSFIAERFSHIDGVTTKDYVVNYFERSKEIINYLNQNMDTDTLEELVKDIHDYKRVVLMGHVQSSFPAISLQYYLTILHKFIYSTQDPNEQREMLETLDDQNLIIIFSAGGRFLERVLDRLSVMDRENGPKIYMITANKLKHFPFVHKYIELSEEFSYSSSVILEMYSNFISLIYHKKYTDNYY